MDQGFTLRFRQLVWMILAGLLMGPGLAMAEGKIRVAAFELPPYVSSKAEGGGPVLVFLDQIFTKLNLQMELDFLPNKRAIQSVMDGKYDAVALVPMVGDHAVQLEFSDVLVVSKNYIYHQQNGPTYSGNLKELKDHRIGGLQALQHDNDFRDYAKSANIVVVESRNPLTVLKMLQFGRIDVAIMPEDVGRWAYATKPESFDDLARSEHYMDISHMAMGMNWESPMAEILWDINAEIDDHKRNGTWQKMLSAGISQFLAKQED